MKFITELYNMFSWLKEHGEYTDAQEFSDRVARECKTSRVPSLFSKPSKGGTTGNKSNAKNSTTNPNDGDNAPTSGRNDESLEELAMHGYIGVPDIDENFDGKGGVLKRVDRVRPQVYYCLIFLIFHCSYPLIQLTSSGSVMEAVAWSTLPSTVFKGRTSCRF